MPIGFRIEGDVLIFHVTGNASFADGMQILREGMAAYRSLALPSSRILIEVESDAEGRTSDEVHTFARALREEAGKTRIAFVAEHDLHFGLARMAQAVGGSDVTLINVFRTRDNAMAWLLNAAD